VYLSGAGLALSGFHQRIPAVSSGRSQIKEEAFRQALCFIEFATCRGGCERFSCHENDENLFGKDV
jgi:hypothetical protein